MTTKHDPDDRERERWLFAQRAIPSSTSTDVAELRRRDIRERRRGMAAVSLELTTIADSYFALPAGDGEAYTSALRLDQAAMIAEGMAGRDAMRWARKHQEGKR